MILDHVPECQRKWENTSFNSIRTDCHDHAYSLSTHFVHDLEANRALWVDCSLVLHALCNSSFSHGMETNYSDRAYMLSTHFLPHRDANRTLQAKCWHMLRKPRAPVHYVWNAIREQVRIILRRRWRYKSHLCTNAAATLRPILVRDDIKHRFDIRTHLWCSLLASVRDDIKHPNHVPMHPLRFESCLSEHTLNKKPALQRNCHVTLILVEEEDKNHRDGRTSHSLFASALVGDDVTHRTHVPMNPSRHVPCLPERKLKKELMRKSQQSDSRQDRHGRRSSFDARCDTLHMS